MDWPQITILDVARRKCVIYLGAGISRNCQNTAGRRPKTWHDFLKNAYNNLSGGKQTIQSLLKKGDYLTACEIIKTKLGRDEFVGLLRDEFLSPRYQHALIHKHIFGLDSRIVATPNFDKIYETYANHEARASIVVKHHYDDDCPGLIREDGRFVLKIHGTIDKPNDMIFTRSEYAQARIRYRDFYDIMDALVLTHTFIFLGCGLSDPDVRLLLENSFNKHPTTRKHIIVLPKRALRKDVKDIVENSMNLKVLEYSPDNNHQELTDSLQALVNQVEEKREDLKNTANW